MDLQSAWSKALSNTEIIRSRVQGLLTFKDTMVPYMLLSESTVNKGDTVVRKGEILVEKPSLILPPNIPQFEGFEFEEDSDHHKELDNPGNSAIVNFFLVRGVTLPSLKYNNKTLSLDIYEGKLKDAVLHYLDQLEKEENIQTGLLIGPEEYWQFSLLIFISGQIVKNADSDVKRLLEEYKKKKFEK